MIKFELDDRIEATEELYEDAMYVYSTMPRIVSYGVEVGVPHGVDPIDLGLLRSLCGSEYTVEYTDMLYIKANNE